MTSQKAGSTGRAPGQLRQDVKRLGEIPRPPPSWDHGLRGTTGQLEPRSDFGWRASRDGQQCQHDTRTAESSQQRQKDGIQGEKDPSRAGGTVTELGTGPEANICERARTVPSGFEPVGCRASGCTTCTGAGEVCFAPGARWPMGSKLWRTEFEELFGGMLYSRDPRSCCGSADGSSADGEQWSSDGDSHKKTGAQPMTPTLGCNPLPGQSAQECAEQCSRLRNITSHRPLCTASPASQHGNAGSLVQLGGTPSPGQPQTPKTSGQDWSWGDRALGSTATMLRASVATARHVTLVQIWLASFVAPLYIAPLGDAFRMSE